MNPWYGLTYVDGAEMADGFTPEQMAQLAQLMNAALDTRLATLQPTVVPTTVDSASTVVVLGDVDKPKRAAKTTFTDEQIAAQRAADLVDPLRSAYTVVARNRIVGQYQHSDYVPVWTAERDRLIRGGSPKGTDTNKQAQVNYDAMLKIEVERLRSRDGITRATMAPPISAESRRSSGTHSDPTANQAVANVSREERAAELRRMADELERGATPVALVVPATPTVPLRSAASVAQQAIKANPRQRTIDKLIRDALASDNAGQLIQMWFQDRKHEHPNNAANYRQIALAAATALKIPTA